MCVLRYLFLSLYFAVVGAQASVEFKRGTLVRDAEIEDVLRSYLIPIFQVAKLKPEALNVHIIIDPSINAAATGEHRIFVQTGLIASSPDVGRLLGVLAHETGHIACGHVVSLTQQMDNAYLGALASMILGAGVAVLGAPDAGMAIITGGSTLAERNLLRHSRTHESAADQAAQKYMDALGWSVEPLAQFMDSLAQKELVSVTRQDPYMSTHPLSRDRVSIMRHHASQSPATGYPFPLEFQRSYDLIRAKVIAYSDRPAMVLQKYSGESVPDRYARAIAYYRMGNISKAKPLLDSLTHENPKNPYFFQVYGELCYDKGDIAGAYDKFTRAVQLSNNPLFKVDLAKTLLANPTPGNLEKASGLLTTVVHHDSFDAFAWHLLAKVKGKQDKMAEMSLALAEYNFLVGDFRECLLQIDRGRNFLKEYPVKNNNQLKLRLNDLERDAQDRRENTPAPHEDSV